MPMRLQALKLQFRISYERFQGWVEWSKGLICLLNYR